MGKNNLFIYRCLSFSAEGLSLKTCAAMRSLPSAVAKPGLTSPTVVTTGGKKEKMGAWCCHGYSEAGLAEKEQEVTVIWMYPKH